MGFSEETFSLSMSICSWHVPFPSKLARASQQIGTKPFLLFAPGKAIGIALAAFFALQIAARRLFTEHLFFLWHFAPTFCDAYANGFTRRLFFAACDEGQCCDDENEESATVK